MTGHKDIDTSRGEAYQNLFAPAMFIPWGEDLVGRAGLRPGDNVLDVACGTGVVSRLAAEAVAPSGSVDGLDLDPGFLEVGRSAPPTGGVRIEFHEGSATDLPFDADSFDLALCQQGLQFFPDRTASLSEMRRVLRPEGKVVLSVWRESQRSPGFHALLEALERHGGAMDAKPASFSLTDSDELSGLAEAAGFREVTIEEAALPVRFDSPERFAEILAASGPGIGRAMARLDDDAHAAMIEDVKAALAQYITEEGLEFPTETHYLTGYA